MTDDIHFLELVLLIVTIIMAISLRYTSKDKSLWLVVLTMPILIFGCLNGLHGWIAPHSLLYIGVMTLVVFLTFLAPLRWYICFPLLLVWGWLFYHFPWEWVR